MKTLSAHLIIHYQIVYTSLIFNYYECTLTGCLEWISDALAAKITNFTPFVLKPPAIPHTASQLVAKLSVITSEPFYSSTLGNAFFECSLWNKYVIRTENPLSPSTWDGSIHMKTAMPCQDYKSFFGRPLRANCIASLFFQRQQKMPLINMSWFWVPK